MAVYDRATRIVPESARLDMYRLYVKKVEHYFGVTKTRPVYERAVSELNDVHARAMCLEFADMERKLGEIDRARAILQHGSQFADPRKDPIYWRRWREFEESHGNEDTFRDMLRVQRSVETANSQVTAFHRFRRHNKLLVEDATWLCHRLYFVQETTIKHNILAILSYRRTILQLRWWQGRHWRQRLLASRLWS
jgi:hypothetical protein